MTKEEKTGLCVFCVICILIIFVIVLIVHSIQLKNKTYEYYKDGQFGISKRCYENKGQCYCAINNEFLEVDSYSE